MSDAVPAIVLELAKKASGTPLAWKVTDSTVVIVFEDGRKLTFDQVGNVGTAKPAAVPLDEAAPSAAKPKIKKEK